MALKTEPSPNPLSLQAAFNRARVAEEGWMAALADPQVREPRVRKAGPRNLSLSQNSYGNLDVAACSMII